VLVLLSGLTKEHGGFIVADGFDYDLVMADGNVATGLRLDVIAGTLAANESVRFDGRAETDGGYRIISGAGDDFLLAGAGADTLYGGRGADRLEGGAGADTFAYRGAVESTGPAFDAIVGFDVGGDRIDLLYEVSGVAAALTSGSLSGASFDGDLSVLATTLAAGQALLITADTGDFASRNFLVIDGDGAAGYQAGFDYVIELVSPAAPIAPGVDIFI
jgi:Ca2+-binding RTX toxin-like protein